MSIGGSVNIQNKGVDAASPNPIGTITSIYRTRSPSRFSGLFNIVRTARNKPPVNKPANTSATAPPTAYQWPIYPNAGPPRIGVVPRAFQRGEGSSTCSLGCNDSQGAH